MILMAEALVSETPSEAREPYSRQTSRVIAARPDSFFCKHLKANSDPSPARPAGSGFQEEDASCMLRN